MRLFRCRPTLLPILLLAIAAQDISAMAAPAAEPPGQDLRSYHDGPLRPADYQAAVPEPRPLVGTIRTQAFTSTRVLYHYRYDYTKADPQVTVTLTRFEPTAFLKRQESWLASPDDSRLLDHEQGHFDIAHLAALRFRQEMERLRQQGKPLQAQGPDLRAAVQSLENKLNNFAQRYVRSAAEEHLKYDKMTSHGRVGSAQAHLRGEQRKQIEALEQQFQSLDKLLSGD